jgi:hypothetical protein
VLEKREATYAAVVALLLNYVINSIAFFSVYAKTFIFQENYSFLPIPKFLAFGDLWGILESWQALGFNGIGYAHSYFPGAYFFVTLFNFFPLKHGMWILILVLQSTLIFAVVLILRPHHSIKIISTILFLSLSQPFFLIWSTGNLEAIVISLILLSFVSYQYKYYYTFTAFLSLAAAIKLFPIVFILILFYRMKLSDFVKHLMFSLVILTIFTSTIIIFFHGGILDGNSLTQILSNSGQSRKMYMDLMYFSEGSIPYGHSFLNGVHALFGNDFLDTRTWMYPVAFLLSFLIFIPSLFVALIYKFEDWKIILIIGIWTLLVVPTSTDYRLAYLFPAIIFILKDKLINFEAMFFLFWIVIIISPKPFFPGMGHQLAFSQIYFSSVSFILIPLFLVGSSIFSRMVKSKT